MKTYSVFETREHFAEILKSVERGEEVVITKQGRPIARITRPLKVSTPPPGFLKAQGWSVAFAEDFDIIRKASRTEGDNE